MDGFYRERIWGMARRLILQLMPLAFVSLTACSGGGNASDSAGSKLLATVTTVNGVATFSGVRNNYAITKVSTGYVVTDNVGSDGTSVITGATALKFTDYSVNLGIGDKSTTIAAADLKLLVELYIAYFNRVPDADGLSYWIDQFKSGRSIDLIAESFYDAAIQYSSVTGYSSSMTNSDFVKIIYKNVLGRSGATAPSDSEVGYWAGELDNGNKTRGSLIRFMLGSAHSFAGDATYGWVPQLLDNKYTVGTYFAVQQGLNFNSSEDNITKGGAIATAVTSTSTTSAMTLIGVNDTTFTLVTSVPGAPTIGIASAGNGAASIAFTAPSSNGGATITGYTATCTGGGVSKTGTGTASPIVVSGLANGTAYSCSVTATNSAGSSAASSAVTVTPTASSVPGTPTIGTATAGNASASIAFTAPASNGGSAITAYTATCTGGGVSKTGTGASSPITVSNLTNGTAYSCSVTATNAVGTSAASSSVSVTPVSAFGTTTTAGVWCPFSQSVYNSTAKLTSTVSITCTSTLRTISGNGVPDHTVGTFPNSGNPNTIGAVTVQYSNTLTPVSTSTSTSVAHKIGYANNSVPFDPATAESYQNAGVWKIEALNQTYFPFGVDTNNAHVQPDGAYHYHGMPEAYITKLGKGTSTMTLVGFALDGFPIYARYGYVTATDATSGVRKMNASYRMKTTPDSGRPSTSTVAMGTFTQDYEYVAGLGDLDECNGRFGVTPEFPNGIYHYYITEGYPYIQRCVKGTPSYNGTVTK
jgi:hypothetical protein